MNTVEKTNVVTANQKWELENHIQNVFGSDDDLNKYLGIIFRVSYYQYRKDNDSHEEAMSNATISLKATLNELIKDFAFKNSQKRRT